MSNLLDKASIILTPTAVSEGVVHTVKPEIELGEELITNGDFSDGGTGWNIQSGVVDFSSDNAIMESESIIRVFDSSIIRINTSYEVEYTILSSGSSSRLQLYDGVWFDVESSVGTHAAVISNTSSGSFTFYLRCRTEGITIDNVSVKEVTQEVVPDSGTAHILLEPESTNLITYSEDFSQWGLHFQGTGSSPTIVSNNSLSPDGIENATRLQCSLNGGNTSSDRSYLKLGGFSGTPFTCIALYLFSLKNLISIKISKGKKKIYFKKRLNSLDNLVNSSW